MTTQPNAQHAEMNGRSLNQNQTQTNQQKILKEKRPNSSIVSAALLLGVSTEVIEMYLPAMLAAHETKKNHQKNVP